MKNNKISEKFKNTSVKNKKLIASASMMILIVTATVALTLAYLADTSLTLVNEFEVPEVVVEIEEEFDYVTKENVTATNSVDSDVDVYVRLKFVVQTLEFVDADSDGVYDSGETGDIIATPDQFDDNGYLENLPITITNVLDVEGLNIDFTGAGYADWFTDAEQSTGIYFYKYSLAPGESAYDLVTEIYQELYYEGIIVRLTIIADSVQVDGVEYAWENVVQSDTYVDANGNPILYSATWSEENGATGVPPTADNDTYTRRFGADDEEDETTTYYTTKGLNSFGESLVVSGEDTDTTE